MRRSVLTALAACAALVACDDPPPPAADIVPAVKTETVQAASAGQTRDISGVIEPVDRTALSFQVPGSVVRVTAETGQRVARGQPLASLDKRPYELARESARARRASARAALSEKRDDLARQTTLFERKIVAQVRVDQARTAAQSAESNLRVAESEVETAERDLKNTVLVAPFDGRVSRRDIEPFVEVPAGRTVFELEAESGFNVSVLVPETMIRGIAYGDAVRVAIPTVQDLAFGGVITKIGSQTETGNAFPVTVRLSGDMPELRSGMTARVTFELDQAGADHAGLAIPLTAIDFGQGERPSDGSRPRSVPVFMFDAKAGHVRRRMVEVGDVRGNRIEVRSGLAPGDVIVVAGVAFLEDGQKVKRWDPRSR